MLNGTGCTMSKGTTSRNTIFVISVVITTFTVALLRQVRLNLYRNRLWHCGLHWVRSPTWRGPQNPRCGRSTKQAATNKIEFETILKHTLLIIIRLIYISPFEKLQIERSENCVVGGECSALCGCLLQVHQQNDIKKSIVPVKPRTMDLQINTDSIFEDGSSDSNPSPPGLSRPVAELKAALGLPSLGSLEHAAGTCKRCNSYPKGRCQNGQNCTFCHLSHDRRKASRAEKREARLSHDASFPTTPSTDEEMSEMAFLGMDMMMPFPPVVPPPGLASLLSTQPLVTPVWKDDLEQPSPLPNGPLSLASTGCLATVPMNATCQARPWPGDIWHLHFIGFFLMLTYIRIAINVVCSHRIMNVVCWHICDIYIFMFYAYIQSQKHVWYMYKTYIIFTYTQIHTCLLSLPYSEKLCFPLLAWLFDVSCLSLVCWLADCLQSLPLLDCKLIELLLLH